jgi:hypothetical protein
MSVDGVQRVQQQPPAGQVGREQPKQRSTNKTKSSVSYTSNQVLVEFWDVVIDVLVKIPFIRNWIQSAWENSIHLLHPNYNEDQPNLSALPFKTPKYFTDSMREHASGVIAENYQRVIQHFSKTRLSEGDERVHKSFASLCYSSYSDCLKGDGADRCHSVLSITTEEFLNKVGQHVRLGTADDPKKRKTLSSDFLSAFCPQLEQSTQITHLLVHGPFAREVDRKKLLDALEKNTSIHTLYFDLDKESTEHMLPLLPHLLQSNPRLSHIVFQNYSKKRNFVIEDSTWQRLYVQVQGHANLETLQFISTPHMPQHLHFPIREKVSFEEN